MTLRTTPSGLLFIMAAEGQRLAAYQCSAGVWTISAFPAGVTSTASL